MVDGLMVREIEKNRTSTDSSREGVEIDFTVLGKSTKAKINHSKYTCILSETTMKQGAIKKNFMKLLYKEKAEED